MKLRKHLCILWLIGLAVYLIPTVIDLVSYAYETRNDDPASRIDYINVAAIESLNKIFPSTPTMPIEPDIELMTILAFGIAIASLILLLGPYSLYLGAVEIKSNHKLEEIVKKISPRYREFYVLSIGHDILIKMFLDKTHSLHTRRTRFILLVSWVLIMSGIVFYVPIAFWIATINSQYSDLNIFSPDMMTAMPIIMPILALMLYIESIIYALIFNYGGYILLISGISICFDRTRGFGITMTIVVLGTLLIGPATGPFISYSLPNLMLSPLTSIFAYIILLMVVNLVCVYPFLIGFKNNIQQL